MRAISTRKVSFQCLYDVIPVLDTGIQLFHNHQNVVFLHKMATFMLTNLIKFLDPSVKHWDGTLLMGQNHNVRTAMDSFAVSQPLTRSGMLANLRSLAN
ncbi:hypothetical protein H9I48_02005 [Wolbachia pipientis]|uniref:hypothetical protein n=1 Tax=Wolbachia pipientis TaxID=955 RepID=UPI001651018E|nr:hypothetical protein [Wolbachia pipientis]MBC6686021.1 hypothetical protein [Wolbachia pipientis]